MQGLRGKPPPNTRSVADDATRIIQISDPASGKTQLVPDNAAADGRGAIIGTAKGANPAAGSADAPPQMPGETVFIPSDASSDRGFDPVVGWLVVRRGLGRGCFRPIFYGQNSIGRGSDQRIVLDFGDPRISRQGHAFLIYDDVAQKFYIRDGGKTNLVRHNGQLVMTPTELHDRDELTIGGTTLLFVALCGSAFDWLTTESQKAAEEAGKAVIDESDQ
jgi:hypothetical protein